VVTFSAAAPPRITLTWCLQFIDIASSHIQIAADSAFALVVLDSTLNSSGLVPATSLVASSFSPGQQYFWRVRLTRLNGTVANWSRTWTFSTASSSIRGTVFEDYNRDSVWNPGERPLAGWSIDVAGKNTGTTLTDSWGNFIVTGLDSGMYTVSARLPQTWSTTVPPTVSYTFMLGDRDSSSLLIFGNYYPWNSVSGTLFDDRNENGVQEPGEEGLQSWKVRLSGTATDSALTDSAGRYTFPRLLTGTFTVAAVIQPSWEQIPVNVEGGAYIIISGYSQHLSGTDFKIHQIPPRVRVTISVEDNTVVASRNIWCGVRAGASYGIWGADTLATNLDYSEGEFDLPPQTAGVFDARFVSPDQASDRFGNGSWTDVRNYTSPAQADTYKISFQPGTIYGGDYPVTLRWSRAALAAGYAGPVTLSDSIGDSIDMKAADSMTVASPRITELTLIARQPIPSVPTGVEEGHAQRPSVFGLAQNYPNPFNPVTEFVFTLPTVSGEAAISERFSVSLKVYDILGREVATIVRDDLPPGTYTRSWDASRAASGIYFYRLLVTGVRGSQLFTDVKKMALIK
jgi:hypothetical protein